MKSKPKFKPSKIIIFEESDGFHWDIKSEAAERGYLDARGKGYPSRAAAMRAAREDHSVWSGNMSDAGTVVYPARGAI